MHSLAKKLAKRDIQALSLHPGNIFNTGLTEHLADADWPTILKRFDDAGRKQPGMKSLDEGLSTILVAALDKGLAGEFLPYVFS